MHVFISSPPLVTGTFVSFLATFRHFGLIWHFCGSLKELDIITLKELSQKLNVIPVIAKGDTLTPEEKTAFKALVSGNQKFAHRKAYFDVHLLT